ncbi:PREDICTED: methyltransferase-like protein 22 [Nanorana parkeri]|uniref:methyltransferase-like protein 22 n=1 Tax=Nanorana parkeri TaxID=125878 RepID=UPI0008545421|nr:PREDICTED: methyltransferase-like protein 22 [Nanorana parkeri]
MEVITFTKDTVLSDVHVHSSSKKHLMVRLNKVGQPVFRTHFKILWQNSTLESASEDCIIITDNEDKEKQRKDEGSLVFKATKLYDMQAIENLLDEDGDLEVQRRPQSPSDRDDTREYARDVVCPTILTIGSDGQIEEEECVNNKDVIKIEHTMATPLEDVGKQIWHGAFLLADYILSQEDLFRGCTALELGAGTGFTSIIMSTVAKTVYCTDVGDDLLEMCERNMVLNRTFTEQAGGGQIKVKELNWLKNQLCTDPENPYSWTEDDIAQFYDHTTVIIAADVFYDDDLTDALFKTLYRITHALRSNCIIYLSMERRYNFTLRHMDVTCDAYNHFRNCLNNFETTSNGKQRWSVQEIKPVFPQFFIYEREHLELWKMTATPLT